MPRRYHKPTKRTQHQILQENIATTRTEVADKTSYNTDDDHDTAGQHVRLNKGKEKLKETMDDEDSRAAQRTASATTSGGVGLPIRACGHCSLFSLHGLNLSEPIT